MASILPIEVVVMCGLSGSGKTYCANMIKSMCEADARCSIDTAVNQVEADGKALLRAEAGEFVGGERPPWQEGKAIPAPGRVKVVSASKFFEQPDGSFVFDPSKIPEAHAAAQDEFAAAFDDPATRIIVIDNCNLSPRDLVGYLWHSNVRHRAYVMGVIFSPTPWAMSMKECCARNIHGTPSYVLAKQRATFDRRMSGLTKAKFDMLWT